MLLLKRLDVSPPDQFHYVNPDTGWMNRQVAYDDWVKAEKNHRRINSLPIPDDLEAQMQDQLCKTIGPEWCEFKDDGTWVNLRFSLGDVVTFTRSLIDAALGNFVSEEEANRRAKICSSCFLNVSVGGCGACHQLNNLVAGDRRTPYDEQLKNCGVCKCYLKAKVHIRMSTLEGGRDKPYPEHCWLKRGGVNTIED